MAKTDFNEIVSVSFHYFEKGVRQETGEFLPSKFSLAEFQGLTLKIVTQPEPDLNIANDFDGVKFGKLVPFQDLEQINEQTFFGVFRSAYWGHSFDNSAKGKIEAQTLNLRKFCFLLYLAESGRIYLACQYLGNYGDYTSLSQAMLKFLALGKNVRSHSIHSDSEDFKGAIPTEVRVTLARQSESITGSNIFNTGSMVAFRKEGKDETFELTVKEQLLSLLGSPAAQIKKQVASLISNSEVFSVNDEDVLDCAITVRAKKSKGTKTVYLFGQGSRATRFSLDVKKDDDGLPMINAAKKAMIEKLQDEIIKKVM